jgi:nanoRNase/pAp phosphatase (c-di-AMP/oligoRNAs hydrolase)
VQWGLRSRNDCDVSIIAQQFSGGGHKHAAGFVTTREQFDAIMTHA